MKLDDVILEAEYIDIIATLLMPPYNITSITKLVFISFCVRNEKNLSKYKNRTKDFVDILISNIAIKFFTHNNEFKRILFAIDILNKTKKVSICGDRIEIITNINTVNENSFLKFCNTRTPNPIIEIIKLEPKALVEEVLRYV